MLTALRDILGPNGFANLMKGITTQVPYSDAFYDAVLGVAPNNGDVGLFDFEKLLYSMIDRGAFGYTRNGLYHQRYLGEVFTDTHKEAIQIGSFHELSLGSFWEIGGVRYTIVGYNSFSGMSGNGAAHVKPNPPDNTRVPLHLVVVAGTGMGTAAINTTGEHPIWTDTDLFKELQPGGRYHAIVAGAFGDDWIVRHKEFLPVEINNAGRAIGYNTKEVTLNIPTLTNYGIQIPNATDNEIRFECPKLPFAMFTLAQDFMTSGQTGDRWFRTPHSRLSSNTSKLHYYTITYNGQMLYTLDSNKIFVTPYFLLGKFREG